MTLWPTPPPVRYGEKIEPLPEGPLELAALIPGDGPLELDIGYGRGRSLMERAATQPGARVLGIEIKAKWAYTVEQRRLARGLLNARALHGDAREILARSVPDAILTRVFVHFPDPWWKKRHGKRRVLGDAMLDLLARLLVPGGELFAQTDVEERAEDYEAALTEHAAFAPAVGASYRIAENPFGALSNREVRATEDGIPVYRILATRLASSGVPRDPAA